MKNEELRMKKLLKKTLKLILPVVLGGFILFWVYRDFDFTKAGDVLLHGTKLVVDALLISVRGVRASLSWMAVEADTGTVGRFPEKERIA